MDMAMMKKLDKYGLLFAGVHTLVFINLAIDFWIIK
ncbi:hypothetical protein BN1050_02283 [Metalysinibacillus saudimassiliensis]|uniref:Uncharacterized protein n=1 Tax=Metalysinibacillus saudimassiliensis TaxID=1461583 RepID=A0A078MFJ1_9BACL|nr:hypothetical protein BN1050_02283 [Metalysinibacillus saudimassiliensis]